MTVNTTENLNPYRLCCTEEADSVLEIFDPISNGNKFRGMVCHNMGLSHFPDNCSHNHPMTYANLLSKAMNQNDFIQRSFQYVQQYVHH